MWTLPYYVDNLAENVRRGNRAKLRRGEWPGQKPFGYVYDHRLRDIVPEPKEAKIVKKIYEEFATGRHTLKSISARLASPILVAEKCAPTIQLKIF